MLPDRHLLRAASFAISFALLLYELLLTRLFAVVLFADFAHLALALAMLGISAGALALHLWPGLVPPEQLRRRVGIVLLVQAVLTVVAVVAAVRFPVLQVFEKPPETYQERSFVRDQLFDPVWFAALMPVLAAPFAAAGLGFSALFSRRKDDIGALYGADLVGAGAAAAAFLPVLGWLAGPDAIFVAVLGALLGSALVSTGGTRIVAGVGALATVGAALLATQRDVIPMREAAGYSDRNVIYTEWTPLTRLAIHRGKRGDLVLLDNASASEIITTPKRRASVAEEANRSLVYRFQPPTGRAAIMAASAGPEVSCAQTAGWKDIDAIDIAGEIFRIVGDRYPGSPYSDPGVRRVHSDGRAAILRAEEPYAVIQMVHANLWSSAGLLANAWSPTLLETREAFGDYLDHLAPDGTISFGRGDETTDLYRAAAAALAERGAAEPWRHIAYLRGGSQLILVRQRPWTTEDIARLEPALALFPKEELWLDPTAAEQPADSKKLLAGRAALTDDHPYVDTPEGIWRAIKGALKTDSGGTAPLAALYRSVLMQCAMVLAGGLLFVGVPLVARRQELRGEAGVGTTLLYVACLGYGYLAVETVLIHGLVLFVGHPTYAITSVVLSMLLASGVGAMLAARIDPRRLVPVLLGVVVLAALQAFVVPPLLFAAARTWAMGLRAVLAGTALLPLGLLMGMAFPLGMRRVPGAAVVPWAWAINGWMSVVATVATTLLARASGYSTAFVVAMLAYALAAGLATRLGR